jgi:thioredoxin-related protein
MKKEVLNAHKNIKKHNTLTDGYILKTGKAVLPDKLLNALYWKYEQEGVKFMISMVELRSLLGLKSIKDDARIIDAIKALRATITLRDFSYKGREVKLLFSSFLSTATMWKDKEKYFEFILDDMVIEAMKQKAGYTPLELGICNQFKTKYGLKLYEMFIRYYHLPNREGKGVVVDIGKENCAACGELEHITFTNPKVQDEIKKRFKFIQIDITNNTPKEQEILKHYGLFGAPNILFFDKNGTALRDKFQVGFIKPEKLLKELKSIK